MIKHKILDELGTEDQYIIGISYIKDGKIETTMMSNDFPVLDMPTVRNEFSGLLFELYDKEAPKPENVDIVNINTNSLDSRITDKQVKGIIK
tara:strand:+ start:2853 stop:3128 length:276 start_codon:yes stop_codon:yes gene_type:complete